MSFGKLVGAQPDVNAFLPLDRPMGSLLEIDAREFRKTFNQRPFYIRHHLSDHPLFSLPSLIELSRRLPQELVKYNSGDVLVGTGLYKGRHTGLSVEETIWRIENCRSWMVIKFVDRDPLYRELLDRCLYQIRALSESVDPGMLRPEAFIFISSPGSVTPYHVDPESNFLLQISGQKLLNIFDASDRSILPDEELEKYLADGDYQLAFKEEYQPKASLFDLSPGLGVHVPVTAPHWVQNGDQVSISFSITFRTWASERRRIVHHTNAELRRRGIRPAPPGQHPFRDSAKFYAFRAWLRAKDLLTGSQLKPPEKY